MSNSLHDAPSVTTIATLPPGRRFLSIAETCEALGLGRSTVERLWRSGELATVRLGGSRLVPVGEIDRLTATALASVEAVR